MTQRNPLVIVNGRIQELPTGDTIVGTSSEEIMYARRIDTVSDSEIYKGEALPGTISSAPNWRICKIVISNGDDIDTLWADGNEAFSKTWDNRASYTYI